METPKQVQDLLDQYKDNTKIVISSIYNVHIENQAKFSFVAILEEQERLVVRKSSPWIGCRGYMCEALFGTSAGHPFRLSGSNYNISKDIHGDVACLLIKDIDELHLSQAVKMLNYLEAGAGWEKSLLRTIKHKASLFADEELTAFLWMGDKRWFSATTYLSLLLLLIRIAGKCLFEPTDILNTWVLKVIKNSHIFRKNDINTLNILFKYHTNTIQILMTHQEFITEELNYSLYRAGRYKQESAQDAGIHSATNKALEITMSKVDLENPSVVANEIEKLHSHYGYLYNIINDTLIIRYSVALNEYGDGRKILKPPRKKTIH